MARLGAREEQILRGWMTVCVYVCVRSKEKPRGPMAAGKKFPCKKGGGVVMF